MALASFGVVFAWARWGRDSKWKQLVSLWLVSLLVATVLLAPDLAGLASRLSESTGVSDSLLLAAAVCGASTSVPALQLLGSWCQRGWLRLAVLPLVAVLFYLNATISPHDNPGSHFYLSWCCALLLAGTLTWPASWLQRVTAIPRWGAVTGAAGAVVWAIASLALPLPNAVRVDLAQWHANLLPQFGVARGHVDDDAEPDPNNNPFFASRADLPPIAPAAKSPLPSNGIVIVLSIDAIRFDTIRRKNRQFFPNIDALRSDGVQFTQARSPGSQTVYTLASLSMGTYFSQQHWSKEAGSHWPIKEDGVHIAQVLGEHGVFSSFPQSAPWMRPERGIMRGFTQSKYERGKGKWATAKELVNQMLPLLKEQRGPAWFFAHFLDTHYPYGVGKKKGRSTKGAYLHALRYVDKHIGRIIETIDEMGARDRTLFIITADHGEGFGEHGSSGHATTLYDEVIRVPLIFSGVGLNKAVRRELVSLVDLGPTLFDLFGVATPPSFMGESLLPLLLGKPKRFQRPIVAEGRGLHAMVFDDGTKVIDDTVHKTLEVYDLKVDRKERRNLADDLTPEQKAHVSRLRAFFKTHTRTEGEYRVPIRK